jgi:hypothetical protein
MTRDERALHAVRIQLQFEMMQAGAKVARATTVSSRLQEQVVELTQCCETSVNELRSVMHRARVNPALLDAMRSLYRAERQSLHDSEDRLRAAREQEHRLRAALTGLRNRERSLERALQAERRKESMKQQALEIVRANDMWMQRVWSQRL